MTTIRTLRHTLAGILDAHVRRQRREVADAVDLAIFDNHPVLYGEHQALQLAWADLVEAIARTVRP